MGFYTDNLFDDRAPYQSTIVLPCSLTLSDSRILYIRRITRLSIFFRVLSRFVIQFVTVERTKRLKGRRWNELLVPIYKYACLIGSFKNKNKKIGEREREIVKKI